MFVKSIYGTGGGYKGGKITINSDLRGNERSDTRYFNQWIFQVDYSGVLLIPLLRHLKLSGLH